MRHQFVAVLASAAVAFAPVVSIAAPAVHAAPAQPGALPHALGLPSVTNARDLGGYRAANGRIVRSGLVFRTAALSSLSPTDAGNLAARPVATVVDLRTAAERALQPDRPVPGAAEQWNDVLGAASPLDMLELSGAYADFVTNAPARSAFAATLRTIATNAAAGKATLFHCSAGKDRTGWTAAVLLTLLGVDRATVNQDYLLSNTYRGAAATDPLNGVNLGWLDTSFAAADRYFGSFANYVRTGLGLSDAEVASLRASLLG